MKLLCCQGVVIGQWTNEHKHTWFHLIGKTSASSDLSSTMSCVEIVLHHNFITWQPFFGNLTVSLLFHDLKKTSSVNIQLPEKDQNFTSNICSAKLMFSSMRLLEEGLPVSAALLVIIPRLETAEIMVMARITDRGNIVKWNLPVPPNINQSTLKEIWVHNKLLLNHFTKI